MSVRGNEENRPFLQAFRENIEAQKWGTKASSTSDNLKRYYDIFDKDQLKIILFDDLKANPETVVTELIQFLEVDPSFIPDTSTIYNEGGVPKRKFLQIAYRVFAGNRKVKNFLKTYLPGSLVTSANTMRRKNLQKAPALELHVRKEIIDYYRDDILRVQDIINQDLSNWLR